jgi:periplasmic protein CpxP/Spy
LFNLSSDRHLVGSTGAARAVLFCNNAKFRVLIALGFTLRRIRETPDVSIEPSLLDAQVPTYQQQHQHGASTMLSPESKQAVATELKRFAGDLNLSDDQKSKLQTALENARERIDEIRQSNPDLTRADVIAKLKAVRGTARERVVQFLTPEQLNKWDAEMARAKRFLGIDS